MREKLMGGMVGILLVTLACGVLNIPTAAPNQQLGVETLVAQTMEALTQNAPAVTETTPAEVTAVTPTTSVVTQTVPPSGIPASFQNVSFVIPNGLATGANPEAVAAVGENEGAPLDVAPAYIKFTLTGYPLQGKFFEPEIKVYPAQEFETVSPGAGGSLQKLRAIIASPSTPLTKENLPGVPTFNAAMVFASNTAVIPFQNGSGVRTLTEYAQYPATVNNHDLFYNFQGLTSDGKYYIIAVLPVNIAFLAVDEDPNAAIPLGGIPIPANGPDDSYYFAVTQVLSATPPDAFTPTLTALDALIQSITVTQ